MDEGLSKGWMGQGGHGPWFAGGGTREAPMEADERPTGRRDCEKMAGMSLASLLYYVLVGDGRRLTAD
jgi:hypothetical protein